MYKLLTSLFFSHQSQPKPADDSLGKYNEIDPQLKEGMCISNWLTDLTCLILPIMLLEWWRRWDKVVYGTNSWDKQLVIWNEACETTTYDGTKLWDIRQMFIQIFVDLFL